MPPKRPADADDATPKKETARKTSGDTVTQGEAPSAKGNSSSSAEERQKAEQAAVHALAEAEWRARADAKEQRRIQKAAKAAEKAEEPVLPALPPSVLDGSNFKLMVRRCAREVAEEHGGRFAAALEPLHDETIGCESFLATVLTGLVRAYEAARAAPEHQLLVFQLSETHERMLEMQRAWLAMHSEEMRNAKERELNGALCFLDERVQEEFLDFLAKNGCPLRSRR